MFSKLTLRQQNDSFGRPLAVLLLLWALSMIALPLAKIFWEEAAVTGSVILTVLLQTAAAALIAARAWGVRPAVVALVVTAVISWAAEAIGSATGFPFGAYSYTGRLQPQMGHVPLLIPLAWFMMLLPAWAVAARIAGRWRGPLFIALSALALTAWDLFLDPQMVGWGFWVWHEPGGYFGIPWVNYAGWIVVGVILTIAVRPRPLPITPLLLIYTATWALQTIGHLFFWGLVGPGLVGGLVMGLFVVLAWRGRG